MAKPLRAMTATALIASPILVVIALAVIAVSIRALVLFAANADTFDLAASIESGALPDADYLARFVERNGLDQVSRHCGDSFTRASLTVNLAALDAATSENDETLIDAAERNAIRAAEQRLACNPLDGNAWLRYAIVEVRGKGPVASVIDDLRMSYVTAPSEAWILDARLAFATNLYVAGVTGFEREYLGDLRRFASFAWAGRVANAYVETAPQVRAQLRPLIEAQADARKKAIVAEIDRLGVDFARQ